MTSLIKCSSIVKNKIYRGNKIKNLNITKKQYDESKYFNNKYGKLKYVSESGNVYKTDKGVVISLESSNKPDTVKEDIDEVEDVADKEEVAAALADVVDTIKAIADDNEIEVPGLAEDDEDSDDDSDDADDDEFEDGFETLDEGECQDGECKEGKCKCECGDKKSFRESAKRAARAKLIRVAIAKRARIRKIKESIARRARARKVLESIKARRAAKKVMESKKFRDVKKIARKAK